MHYWEIAVIEYLASGLVTELVWYSIGLHMDKTI